jgi:hypothetical protein
MVLCQGRFVQRQSRGSRKGLMAKLLKAPRSTSHWARYFAAASCLLGH